jgi:putative methionine-R-sulfoxide reductase with GAF domain
MFERRAIVKVSKADPYAELAVRLEALLQGERDFVANAANTAARRSPGWDTSSIQ